MEDNNTPHPNVSSTPPREYGADHANHLLEQYKIAVEMASRISTQRQTANSFFLTIASATLAFTALFSGLAEGGSTTPLLPPLGMLAISIAGIAVCTTWATVIKSFRTLNSAKYKIITALEQHLPARIYAAEWELLDFGVRSKHRTLTTIEKGIPVIFGFLYATTVVLSLERLLLGSW